MLLKIVLTAASVVALTAAANAADLGSYKGAPAYAGVNWSGLYGGVSGGYGSGNEADVTLTHNAGNWATAGSTQAGWLAGGQIGYNVQGVLAPNLVLGVEADIQGAGITGSNTTDAVIDGANHTATATVESTLDWVGSVRGRLGYSFGSTLVYGTGGLAVGGINKKVTYKGSAGSTPAGLDSSTTATGYTAGAGVEYAFNQAWSAKAEYQYIDLGTETYSPAAAGGYTGSAKFDNVYNTVRFGVNYHFGRGLDSLK